MPEQSQAAQKLCALMLRIIDRVARISKVSVPNWLMQAGAGINAPGSLWGEEHASKCTELFAAQPRSISSPGEPSPSPSTLRLSVGVVAHGKRYCKKTAFRWVQDGP